MNSSFQSLRNQEAQLWAIIKIVKLTIKTARNFPLLRSLLLETASSPSLGPFPSALGSHWSTSCRCTGLPQVLLERVHGSPSAFVPLGMFVSPSFWKDIFAGYRILNSQFLLWFSTLNISGCLRPPKFLTEKSRDDLRGPWVWMTCCSAAF